MSLRYSEELEHQNAGLMLRMARASEYLDVIADQAEAERERMWDLPGDVQVESYSDYIKPFRETLRKMIGFPPPGLPVNETPTIRKIGSDADGEFSRVTLQLLEEGLDSYGLLIKPSMPAIGLAVAIHGGAGTPELAAGLLGQNNYHDMGRRLARQGYIVWMPACYERLRLENDADCIDVREILDLKARIVGSSLTAIDIYSIIKSTEAIIANVCPEFCTAVAVGLSYGGFRALLACALSDTFSACVSSCYFNNRRRVLESNLETRNFRDWYFNGVLRTVTDVELCRLICPKPLFVEVAANDELFPVEGAMAAAENVQRLYDGLGIGERFEFDVFEGVHEFSGRWAFPFLVRMTSRL